MKWGDMKIKEIIFNNNKTTLFEQIISFIKKDLYENKNENKFLNKIKFMKKYFFDKNNIKFVHISKTGGSTIEEIGLKHGMKWGQFDNEYLNKDYIKLLNCSSWHTPIKYYRYNPYKDNILFTVVRNPYDRVLSEFYCPYTGYFSRNNYNNDKSNETYEEWLITKKNHTINDFNNWINKRLTEHNVSIFKKIKEILKHEHDTNQYDNNHTEISDELQEYIEYLNKTYCLELQVHFMPYYEYFTFNDEPIISYVLRFENLVETFNNLFENEMNINIHINKSHEKRFSISDLSEDNIILINKLYHKDFILFNYEKII